MRATSNTRLTKIVIRAASLTLLLSTGAHAVQAAGPNLGVALITAPRGLFVWKVTSAAPFANLCAADQITSVNGRRVETEAAFMSHLMKSNGSVTLTVIRSGRVRTLEVRPRAGGLINPSDLVMTSRGVMHKDVAARLGLEGTPISGTAEPSNTTAGN